MMSRPKDGWSSWPVLGSVDLASAELLVLLLLLLLLPPIDNPTTLNSTVAATCHNANT